MHMQYVYVVVKVLQSGYISNNIGGLIYLFLAIMLCTCYVFYPKCFHSSYGDVFDLYFFVLL